MRKGSHHSEATKQKYKERVYSAELRAKISAGCRLRYSSPLVKSGFYGKHHTEENKRKMSLMKKGKKLSTEHRRKLALAQKNREPASEETRRKISIANTGKVRSIETRQKISVIKRGQKHSLLSRQHMGDSHKGFKHSKATRRKMSASRKAAWAKVSLEDRHRHTYPARKAVCSPSSIEKTMHFHLRKAGVKFQSQKAFRPYFVDIFVPKLNLVIECDGEYWHSSLEVQCRDRKRDRYLISRYGVRVVRVPEKSIRENPKLVVSTILGGIRQST